jgi:hypothetical protein
MCFAYGVTAASDGIIFRYPKKLVSAGTIDSLEGLIKARLKCNPLLEGTVLFAVQRNEQQPFNRVIADCNNLHDDTLITALAIRLISIECKQGETIRLYIQIPECLPSLSAIRCGKPRAEGETIPILAVIREIQDENDEKEGEIFQDLRYIGSSIPGMVNAFALEPGLSFLLFRKKPAENIFNVLPMNVEAGYIYFVKQEFRDTTGDPCQVVKSYPPARAREIIKASGLKTKKGPITPERDISKKDYSAAMDEYSAMIAQRKTAFYEKYIGKSKYDPGLISIRADSCR